ncbi:MAG: ATP-dependent Clp protease ATP-binding subunit, partial [Clostridia bacterium]|nr:ATP-dependent Clp protease ATP-binding subunit [Clostridia bacterium]
VDEVVYFAPLSKDGFAKIAELMLAELKGPLAERGITFSWTAEAAEHLAAISADGKRGARDLRNAVRRHVENRIALLLVNQGDSAPATITAVLKDGEVTIECGE